MVRRLSNSLACYRFFCGQPPSLPPPLAGEVRRGGGCLTCRSPHPSVPSRFERGPEAALVRHPCLLVGAPGFEPGRLQQSAAPAYKTEPHTSADAVLVGVAGFEPATSSFRTKSASRLRYTPEMARCTG